MEGEAGDVRAPGGSGEIRPLEKRGGSNYCWRKTASFVSIREERKKNKYGRNSTPQKTQGKDSHVWIRLSV